MGRVVAIASHARIFRDPYQRSVFSSRLCFEPQYHPVRLNQTLKFTTSLLIDIERQAEIGNYSSQFLRRLVAEYPHKRRVDRKKPPVRRALIYTLYRIFEYAAIASLGLFELFRESTFGLSQTALLDSLSNRLSQSAQAILQQIVGCPASHRSDGGLLAYRSRYDNEGNFEAAFL